ncbi:flavin-binding monooxygenase-like protein [Bombardia bombarda]|uniref:Flavin-binding monooxygenase-like protein n=1 Tax=Bombardia bombarda TaxID=252184 RepID=A0AA39TM30_9PEZI|nr:flavin-binding monooxygenase-like protein [Bombardia bombarda]
MGEAAAYQTASSQRLEPGSVNIPPCPWPATLTAESIDATAIASNIVNHFNQVLAENNHQAAADLFVPDGFWRDHAALSWDLRTLKGRENIRSFLDTNRHTGVTTKLEIDLSSDFRKPQVAKFAPASDIKGIGFFVKTTTKNGTGRGVVRLAEKDGAWGIWNLFTTLEAIHGTEEALGPKRPRGVNHGGQPGRKNWLDRRKDVTKFVDSDPDVLIIGTGQSGLTAHARLQILGIPTLIIDRNASVGDNWRKRYHQLVLHDPVWYDHMPYLPFPATWPIFTPKDKLAEWFESYAKALELDIWMQSELRSSSWDDDKKQWTVTIARRQLGLAPDGSEISETIRTLHPKHIIQATGHSGKKYFPSIPGMDTFQGDLLCHSADFPGAKDLDPNSKTQKKAVVVGACNSSHDICQDYYERGYAVTMVQRSSTCVVSSTAATQILLAPLYSEGGPPVEDADIWLWGWPSAILKSIQFDLAALARDLDKDLLSGLEKAGFLCDKGIDDGGLFSKYLQRGGGYYIDVGTSQLIIDGKILVKQGQEVTTVLPKGIKLADGTEIEADEVIFATGYDNMRTEARTILGDELADRVGDIWGWDEEGEMRGIWRGSGHPGFWFHGGNLAMTRYYSRVLALQIKARLDGLE